MFLEKRKFKNSKGLTLSTIYEGEDKEAKNITCPTIVVHGDIDDVVPLAQSQRLVKNLSGEKRLAVIHGASHDFTDANIEDAAILLSQFFITKLL